MPPTVILIRHGEAEHNATKNWSLSDPPLTKLGEDQCRQLEEYLRTKSELADQTNAIITSPFVRTVQTTLIGLDWLIKRGVKVETDALWQENSAKPCDTGSPMSVLRDRFPEVDFSNLDPVYPKKTLPTKYAFTKSKVLARGQMCLENLYKRPEKVITVVSHSGFLRTAVSKRNYANADFRIFTFAGEPGSLSLVESEMTEGKGGMGWSDPGVAEVVDRDFPAEVIESVKSQQGSQRDAEATKEVP